MCANTGSTMVPQVRLRAAQVRGFRKGQRWVGIGCAAQLVCILLFNALTIVFNRYMQRARSPPAWT